MRFVGRDLRVEEQAVPAAKRPCGRSGCRRTRAAAHMLLRSCGTSFDPRQQHEILGVDAELHVVADAEVERQPRTPPSSRPAASPRRCWGTS